MIEYRDPGDEDDGPALVVHDEDVLSTLLAEWGDVSTIDWRAFEFVMLAQGMRDCCRACAAEACGEDGS